MSEHAIESAQYCAKHIVECLQAINKLEEDGNTVETETINIDGEAFESPEYILDHLREWPLSVQFRSGWVSSTEDMQPAEYEILLATGGPAVRIIGDLDEYGQPYTASLQWQDWGTPWGDTELNYDTDDLIWFASHFYFGE